MWRTLTAATATARAARALGSSHSVFDLFQSDILVVDGGNIGPDYAPNELELVMPVAASNSDFLGWLILKKAASCCIFISKSSKKKAKWRRCLNLSVNEPRDNSTSFCRKLAGLSSILKQSQLKMEVYGSRFQRGRYRKKQIEPKEKTLETKNAHVSSIPLLRFYIFQRH